MADRASQNVAEVAASGTPNARSSQNVGEALGAGTPKARATQNVAEGLGSGAPNARASQNVAEATASGSAFARVAELALTVLMRSVYVTQPPILPDNSVLPGIGFSTYWNPKFYNASEKSPVGVDVDLALADAPTHDFELTINLLRNDFGDGSAEFRTFMGFWLQLGGQRGRFLFANPQDRSVTGQALFTTDGINSQFGPLVRTFGANGFSGTEPIGYFDTIAPSTFYLNGVPLVPGRDYTIISTRPGAMMFKFTNTPAGSLPVTGDFSYYYYCKFADDQMSFEQFMFRLNSVSKVAFSSVRAVVNS